MAAGKKKESKKSPKKGGKKVRAAEARMERRGGDGRPAKGRGAVPMNAVPEPPSHSRTVLSAWTGSAQRALVSGGSGMDYLCGSCGACVLSSVDGTAFGRIVFVCPSCGTCNELRA
ncbi:MAG: hypothetical protein ACYCU7_08015 [Acidimicrobiales bacterium]